VPVFISHRTADDAIAQHVHDRLKNHHRIECYIDNLDREINASNVTALIVRRIKQCTNLLALVTKNTKESWWVPFEVGVAREAPRIITSFTNLEQRDLPEYLTEWPVLRGDSAVDTFADYYKRGAHRVKTAFLEHRAVASDGIAGIEDFHRKLKFALGQ
jgi:hypothetical protein